MSKSSVQMNIPYFSQWESPELVERIVNNVISASDDPLWKESGAESKEVYEHWSYNICGLACFKMILKATTGQTFRTMDLVKLALKYQCLDTDKGLYYREFCTMVNNTFKLEANFTEQLTIDRIQQEMSNNNFAIASVHSSIRNIDLQQRPDKKGGHLILITGYNKKNKTVTYHDPAGLYDSTQQNRTISETDFLHFTPQRGILIINSHHEHQ